MKWVFGLLILLQIDMAKAIENRTCQQVHQKAITSCSAHEHSISPASLSIVSGETRKRIIQSEQNKLNQLKKTCLEVQNSCALICDEEMETATLEGSDVALPLENLTDCRQGKVARQIKAINVKLHQLKRIEAAAPAKQPPSRKNAQSDYEF